jgi:RHS repeat-associated protein
MRRRRLVAWLRERVNSLDHIYCNAGKTMTGMEPNMRRGIVPRTRHFLGPLLLTATLLLSTQLVLAQGAPAIATPSTNAAEPPAHATGQTATLLPTGQWLLVGGFISGQAVDTIALADLSGTQPLSLQLLIPRSGHTTTVLPDGSLFVFGGTDGYGNLIDEGEVIDLSANTVSIVGASELLPRMNHTATLLTDGRVLFAGGLDSHGLSIATSQLWTPINAAADGWSPRMLSPRSDHTAQLLANGEGLISGGRNRDTTTLPDEIFNPSSNEFELAIPRFDPRIEQSIAAAAASPAVAETLPAAEAVDVPVSARFAIRFSKPVRIEGINASTMTLVGPNGVVSGRAVGAEGGMLAFFTPTTDLAPGTTYTAFLQGAADYSGRVVPFTSIRFTTHRYEEPLTSPSTAAPTIAPNAGSVRTPAKALTSGIGAVSAKIGSSKVSANQAETPSPRDAEDEIEDWVPREENRHGAWRVLGLAGDPALAATAQSTVDLAGPAGQTGLTGHVVRMNGRPLPGISVRMGTASTVTDASGRFLLTGIEAGTQELLVDGTEITDSGWHYTKHYLQVHLTAGKTTRLPGAVFLPRVNPATEIAISSPAAQDIILTHPAIPGLEVHIPKGAVLREHNGKIVTTLSITPIPIDRVPYPLPTNFSVYFTLQPGGAFLDAVASKSITIIYPNYLGLPPGARVNFWNYDPSGGGWVIYGQGTVTTDGKQVAPDYGVGFRQFMSFSFGLSSGGNPPAVAPPVSGSTLAADPVDTATGLFVHSETDMLIKDVIPISVGRMYRQLDNVSRTFGVGTSSLYSMYLYIANTAVAFNEQDAYLILPDGGRVHYTLQSSGYPATWENLDSPGVFYGSTLVQGYYPGTDNETFAINLTDHTILYFTNGAGVLYAIADSSGNTVMMTINGGLVSQITSPNGRYIQLAYDSSNRIKLATDNLGRTVSYTYDTSGRLYQVTDQNGQVESYYYDSSNRMTSWVDKRGNSAIVNTYDANSRVLTQTLPDGALWQFAYTTNANNVVTATSITDPRGFIRQETFNASGYATQHVYAMGQTQQQTYTLQLNSANKLTSITDSLQRVTTYNNYDAYGNPASITLLSGTANAVTAYFTYDPTFHHIQTYQDIYGDVTQFYYDSSGKLNQLTNGINNSWTSVNNSEGLPSVVTDPLGHTIQLGYLGGDLVSVTDGLNRTSNLYVNAVGRLVATAEPLRNIAQYSYDKRDQLLQRIDPLGGITTMTYDPNGNLLSLTDPRNLAAHGYTFDSRNRVHIYTDPLGNTATYSYDGMSNLTSIIDRNGKTTSYQYDPLNRLTTVTYADNSTVTIQWDAGSRPQTIADSLNGTITQTYDGLNRLTEEQSPQGQVVYAYNLTNPRVQMTVNSNPTINYTFDAATRLTNIVQGSNSVVLAPDAANRPGTITYPNGIVTTYGFDAANQLLSLNYANGSTSIGGITYTYDLGGRRISMSGSLATLQAPSAVSATTYDAANRMTAWNGSALTYDNNGNLLTGPSGSYGWNVRGQLTTSPATGSYAYDALGRRTTATVSSATNTYLYNGSNPAQISGTQILGGPGLDDVYAQVTSSATTSVLRDGLNDTVALTNSSGTTIGSYSYAPYGATTNSGTSSSTLQYTGRENDGASGLYYYRARYYSPQLSRFISQDPTGFAGGINTYAYVGGDPIGRLDPTGLAWQVVIGAGATGIVPYLAGGFNFNVGLNFDGWNSSAYIQDQLNVGVGAGRFVGAGLNLAIAHAAAPETGFDSQQYIEADLAAGPGLGVSMTGNSCGGYDLSGGRGVNLRGLKPGVGTGGGAFYGRTLTATAVSPSIYSVLNAILLSTVTLDY